MTEKDKLLVVAFVFYNLVMFVVFWAIQNLPQLLRAGLCK